MLPQFILLLSNLSIERMFPFCRWLTIETKQGVFSIKYVWRHGRFPRPIPF